MDTRETLTSLKKYNVHLRDIMHKSAEEIFRLSEEMEKVDTSISAKLYRFIADNYPDDPIQHEVVKKLNSAEVSA